VVQIHSPRPIILKSATYRNANSRGAPGPGPGSRWFKTHTPRPFFSLESDTYSHLQTGSDLIVGPFGPTTAFFDGRSKPKLQFIQQLLRRTIRQPQENIGRRSSSPSTAANSSKAFRPSRWAISANVAFSSSESSSRELLLRNEYLGAENRILRRQIKGHSFEFFDHIEFYPG
jgi:hypothetical protein